MKILDDKHLMFIEPKARQIEEAVQDDLTAFAEHLEATMKPNSDNTRGWHTCACRKAFSKSHTFSVSLFGKLMTTNSLLVHYVKNHRSEIPQSELDKLNQGLTHYKKFRK